jgi:hypothetical protein
VCGDPTIRPAERPPSPTTDSPYRHPARLYSGDEREALRVTPGSRPRIADRPIGRCGFSDLPPFPLSLGAGGRWRATLPANGPQRRFN